MLGNKEARIQAVRRNRGNWPLGMTALLCKLQVSRALLELRVERMMRMMRMMQLLRVLRVMPVMRIRRLMPMLRVKPVFRMLPVLAVIVAILSGCATEPKLSSKQLGAINTRIGDYTQALRVEHGFAILSWGLGTDHITMEIRKYGDFEHVVTDEEIEQFRKTLYQYMGKKFPLELGVRQCCESPGDITGTVHEVDLDLNRLLIVNEQVKNGNTDNPVAVWVSLEDDGKIVRANSGETLEMADVTVGQQASAWSVGMQLDSYPAQTWAVKIEIAAEH